MSLGMRERLGLQKRVKQNLATLRGGEVGMRERLSLQKQIKADLAKLGGEVEAVTPAHERIKAALDAGDSANDRGTTLTSQAARGDFNGLGLPEFIDKLKEAYSADEDLEGAKEAAVGYLEANQYELEAA